MAIYNSIQNMKKSSVITLFILDIILIAMPVIASILVCNNPNANGIARTYMIIISVAFILYMLADIYMLFKYRKIGKINQYITCKEEADKWMNVNKEPICVQLAMIGLSFIIFVVIFIMSLINGTFIDGNQDGFVKLESFISLFGILLSICMGVIETVSAISNIKPYQDYADNVKAKDTPEFKEYIQKMQNFSEYEHISNEKLV